MRVFQGAFEFIERKNLKKKFTAALKILQSFRTFSSFFAKFPDILCPANRVTWHYLIDVGYAVGYVGCIALRKVWLSLQTAKFFYIKSLMDTGSLKPGK